MISLEEQRALLIVNIVGLTLVMGILVCMAIEVVKTEYKSRSAKKELDLQKRLSKDFTKETERKIIETQRITRGYDKTIEYMAKLINSDMIKLGRYIDRIISPMQKSWVNDSIISKMIFNIKVPIIRAILYKKIQAAYEKHINVITDIPFNIKVINMDSLELMSLLGVLLDNAIEAAEGTDTKILYVGLYQEEIESVVIKIGNSCKNCPDIESMYKWEYSTKGEGRGIGLSNVKKIIEKYKGSIDTFYDKEAEMLIQELIV